MSASNAKSTTATATKATAPKATPAPMAPLFSMGPWPAKAQGGNSIRAYCYNVAKALAKAKPNGFTAAEYAAALAGAQAGSTYKQPSAGWGTVAKPNGNAHSHANWFTHAKQGWLAPVAAKATAPKAKATAPKATPAPAPATPAPAPVATPAKA